jgi:hypothetical protein
MRSKHSLRKQALSPKKTLCLAPGRVFSGGVATLPLPQNHHLPRSHTRGLWKLTDLTGLWTRFEVALGGIRAHSPLENLRFPTGPWTRFEVHPRGSRVHSSHSPRFLRSLFFEQEVLDVRAVGTDTVRLRPEWPGLKCSSVAAFGCSVRA